MKLVIRVCLTVAMVLAVTVRVDAQRKQSRDEAVLTAYVADMARLAATEDQPNDRPVLQHRPRYLIQKGDVITIHFTYTPDYDQTVTVQPDGYITARNAGDLHAEGMTTPELTEALKKAYSNILRDPAITVELKDFEKPYIVVGGWVAHPGKYDLRGDTTVTQAVALAGGFTEFSKHSHVLLFRSVNDSWTEVKQLNIKKMINSANLTEDVHLQPGDMIYVPQNTWSKVKSFIIPRPSVGLTGRANP
jgi:protein involved in polysaccharide export with SLBB domain